MSDLRVGQIVWANSNRWTPEGWVPVRKIATVVDPCVQNDPDYAGQVEIKTAGTLNREFYSRADLETIEEAAEPDLIAAAEAVLASAFVTHYRLISPFKELAAALAKAKGGAE